jgi:K+-transporting ATPase ATPase C chain
MANNAAGSSGSNQGPTNPALVDAVKGRIAALKAADPSNHAPVPVDLVTASASGLDPDISLAGAEYQVGRIAQARNIAPQQVRALIEANRQDRVAGLFGEPRVNVLALNLALDGKPVQR